MLEKLFLPGVVLRLESAVLLAVSLFLYSRLDGSWLLLVVLILAPDLSWIGYAAGTRVGAIVYNLIHAYVLPALLGAYGIVTGNSLALQLALIWFAHIGADRLFGFGLKYPTAFKDTHLARV